MNGTPEGRAKLLVVGGCGGLVGRALREEFVRDHDIVSVHRHRAPSEEGPHVTWIRADVGAVVEWAPYLRGIDAVVVVAWHRAGPHHRFAPLARSLTRLIRDAETAGVHGFVQLSVPDAPPRLEEELPYLYAKREVDRALLASRLPFTILRPTMLFGSGDRLLSVMLRTMRRYRRFPMFGDGRYHLSPLAASDLASIVRRELGRGSRQIVPAGGPRRWGYQELTDRMFAVLGLVPKYLRFSPAGSLRIARLFELTGSTKLYRYEVEWLLSDRLGLPAYEGLGRPLQPVEPFLESEAARLHGY